MQQAAVRTLSNMISDKLKVDPATLMAGLTQEKLDNDKALLDFIQANFPEAFEEDPAAEDPIYAQMRAMGYSTEKPHSYAGKKTKEEKALVHYPLNIRPLTSYRRDTLREEGSHNSTKLRNQFKMIPGILYGSDPTKGIRSTDPSSKISVKTPWDQIKGELARYRRNFESRVYDVTLKEHPDDEDGTVYRVTPQNVNWHPIKETIYCCNFLRYHARRPLMIPYNYLNTEDSPALKRDGFVVPITRKVEVFVEDGVDIPTAIDVECTGAKFREVLRLDRLILPDGVRVSDRVLKTSKRPGGFIVGVIFGGSRGQNAELDDETPAPAAAAPAATAATGKS